MEHKSKIILEIDNSINSMEHTVLIFALNEYAKSQEKKAKAVQKKFGHVASVLRLREYRDAAIKLQDKVWGK